MSDTEDNALLVLGLGNLLCSDDGVGVHAVRKLAEAYEVPPRVRLLDGGTLGLSLLRHFEGIQAALLVDAIRVDAPPGSLVRLEGEDVEPAVRERLSVHQIGVADLLDALRLLDIYPRTLRLIGLVPGCLELGIALSAQVERGLPALVDELAREIGRLGHLLVPREGHETRSEIHGTKLEGRHFSVMETLAISRAGVDLGQRDSGTER